MKSRLSREQVYALLMLHQRGNNRFSTLNKDVTKYIGNIVTNTDSRTNKLLSAIAYGDLIQVKELLKDRPRLVLGCGDVTTPSGLLIENISPLECALGAGDPEIAHAIHEAFERVVDANGNQVPDAVNVRASQYERYRSDIENMLNETPYDFKPIIDAIKAAPAQDVAAELKLKQDHESDLHNKMEKFRSEYTPDKTKAGKMHFRYVDVLEIIEIINREFDSLFTLDNDNYNKLALIIRQIYGYVQRNLPAIDRMVFAAGLYTVVEVNHISGCPRSFYSHDNEKDFPITADDESQSGLGFTYCIQQKRWRRKLGDYEELNWTRVSYDFKSLLWAKQSSLIKLMPRAKHMCVMM